MLAGIRVLDLTRLLPGAYATLLLSDLGADVVKIEQPGTGDYMRTLGPRAGDVAIGYAAANRGKRSCALNLKDPRGRALFLRLAERSDVVVEGFRPGVADRLGVGYAMVAARNPAVVYCSLSGYGQSGPDRLRAGHDITYLAQSGILSESRDAAGDPVVPSVQIADLAGGMIAAIGVLAALLRSRATGQGCHVDAAMSDVLISWAAPLLMAAAAPSPTGPPINWLSGGLICYHVYRTADGRHVALGALERKFWEAFCRGAGCERLLPAHLTPASDANPAYRELRSVFAAKRLADWKALADRVDTILMPVRSLREAVDDPQYASRGLFAPGSDPALPLLVGPALRIDGQCSTTWAPAPHHGEHTDAVLRELGVSAPERERLRREGVTAARQGGPAQG